MNILYMVDLKSQDYFVILYGICIFFEQVILYSGKYSPNAGEIKLFIFSLTGGSVSDP